MALVRQKCEVQIKIYSSSFCWETNSILFCQHLHDMQSMPPSPETRHITVLRAYKVGYKERFAGSGKKNDKLTRKQAHTGQATGWEKSNLGYPPDFSDEKIVEYPPAFSDEKIVEYPPAFSDEKIVEYPPAQPTRIVVLKPSHWKIHDMIKALVSPPRMLHVEDFDDEPEDVEGQERRAASKVIARNMRENLMGPRRDETLLSST